MVKKISGKKPSGKASGATPVQPTKTVSSAKVGAVGTVKGAERAAPSKSLDAISAEITPQMKEEIFQLIDEVADNMFKTSKGYSEKKKETLKNAVKIAIEAGMVEGE
jgi:hypothetical protein